MIFQSLPYSRTPLGAREQVVATEPLSVQGCTLLSEEEVAARLRVVCGLPQPPLAMPASVSRGPLGGPGTGPSSGGSRRGRPRSRPSPDPQERALAEAAILQHRRLEQQHGECRQLRGFAGSRGEPYHLSHFQRGQALYWHALVWPPLREAHWWLLLHKKKADFILQLACDGADIRPRNLFF